MQIAGNHQIFEHPQTHTQIEEAPLPHASPGTPKPRPALEGSDQFGKHALFLVHPQKREATDAQSVGVLRCLVMLMNVGCGVLCCVVLCHVVSCCVVVCVCVCFGCLRVCRLCVVCVTRVCVCVCRACRLCVCGVFVWFIACWCTCLLVSLQCA